LDVELAHVLNLRVRDESGDKVICLPKELRKLGNSEDQSISTLMELSLRTVFKYHRTSELKYFKQYLMPSMGLGKELLLPR
jgi:hypothetical protein